MPRGSKGSDIKRGARSKSNVHAHLDQSGSSNSDVRRGGVSARGHLTGMASNSSLSRGSGSGSTNGRGKTQGSRDAMVGGNPEATAVDMIDQDS